jgi:hypothetical protein
MRITRGLERATSDFELSVSERWELLADETVWQIPPGAKCEIMLDGELVLTGYVDAYKPTYDAGTHSISLTGRSKTCDFVDCSVLVDGGQFVGMTVGAIAAELAQPFGIEIEFNTTARPNPRCKSSKGRPVLPLLNDCRVCKQFWSLMTRRVGSSSPGPATVRRPPVFATAAISSGLRRTWITRSDFRSTSSRLSVPATGPAPTTTPAGVAANGKT